MARNESLTSDKATLSLEDYEEMKEKLWEIFRDEAKYRSCDSRQTAIQAAEALMKLEKMKPRM